MSVNGAAETTAAITLTTPSGDVPLIYYSQYYPGYGYYGSAATFAYVPGGTYTLTTITSIGTATATLVAPGGGVSVSPDGSTASWNVEGNEDYINVWGGGLAGFSYQSGKTTSDVDTPFPIPSSAYPVPGTYRVEVVPQNATYNVTGAAPGSYFYIDDDEVMTVTR